jgi:hypothetical protein
MIVPVLHQAADRVVGQRRDEGGVEGEAALQAAGDVVFDRRLPTP